MINLQYADIENKKVPDNAFYNYDDQMDLDERVVYVLWLQRMILPEYITEIGDEAFEYAVNLMTINFPKSLKKIGNNSFYTCRNLNPKR